MCHGPPPMRPRPPPAAPAARPARPGPAGPALTPGEHGAQVGRADSAATRPVGTPPFAGQRGRQAHVVQRAAARPAKQRRRTGPGPARPPRPAGHAMRVAGSAVAVQRHRRVAHRRHAASPAKGPGRAGELGPAAEPWRPASSPGCRRHCASARRRTGPVPEPRRPRAAGPPPSRPGRCAIPPGQPPCLERCRLSSCGGHATGRGRCWPASRGRGRAVELPVAAAGGVGLEQDVRPHQGHAGKLDPAREQRQQPHPRLDPRHRSAICGREPPGACWRARRPPPPAPASSPSRCGSARPG